MVVIKIKPKKYSPANWAVRAVKEFSLYDSISKEWEIGPINANDVLQPVSKVEQQFSKLDTLDVTQVVYCKDCIHRSTRSCPMYFEYWSNGFDEPLWEDHTIDDGYCNYGSDGNGT